MPDIMALCRKGLRGNLITKVKTKHITMTSFILDSDNNSMKWLQPEWVFVVFALIFGVGFVFVNAPYQAPDEGAHFWRACHVSQGNLIITRKGNAVGGQIPKAAANAHLPYEHLIGHPEERVNMDIFAADLVRPYDPEKKVFIDFFTPSLFTPVVYLPQALGIAVGRAFNLSALKMMYTGRISALLCWTVMLYIAIRVVPVLKWLFLVVALQPRSLFQAASLSADGPTNAIALLLTAMIMKAIFGKEPSIGKSLLWTILILSILLSTAKQVYLPLVGLVFLIPVTRFGDWKNKLIYCGVVIAAALLATGLWSIVIRDLYVPRNGANAPEQMALIMAQPWMFLVITFNSLLESWKGLFVSFIGVLGFLDIWLPNWIYFTYPFVLIAAALFDANQKKSLKWLDRSWIILICIVSLLLIELSIYLTWTKPGNPIVVGVHGRYFIPLIIPALLALFYNQRLRLFKMPILQLSLSLYLFCVMATSCWTVWARYYGAVS